MHGGAWSSSETFTAEANGVVNVTDPMRLFWAATRERSSTAGPPDSWELTAEINGAVVTKTAIERRAGGIRLCWC